jgi:hypothetical protein
MNVLGHRAVQAEEYDPMRAFLAGLAFAAAAVTATGARAANPAPTVEKVALMPVTGTNVHAGYLDAARDIMKDHLMQTGRYNVITVAGESGAVEASVEQAVARGRDAGAELAVVVHLARLSGTGRVRLIAYRVPSGALAHSDSIAISGGPDDLDPALKRLAVGMATGKQAGQTADIESVTQKDADPYLKQTATKMFGVRLDALMAFNRPAEGAAALPGIGVFWMYDARSFLGEIALDAFMADGDGGGFSVGLGGYYPFSRENFTPYVGTAASYSIFDLGGAGANGIRLAPVFGVLFGRLSTVQFRGELGYFFNTFGERAEAIPAQGGEPMPVGERHYAHGPQLTIGLGF